MHTLGDMAKALNRPAVVLHGFQSRFDLPAMEGLRDRGKLMPRIRSEVKAGHPLLRGAARWSARLG